MFIFNFKNCDPTEIVLNPFSLKCLLIVLFLLILASGLWILYFHFIKLNSSELKKLSEESLARPPEEVFDIICKLGEGSYGSVYKALHKESGVVCIPSI